MARRQFKRGGQRQHGVVKLRQEVVHEIVIVAEVVVEAYEFVLVGADGI